MSIKFRRNYPLVLALIALISILVFALGDQRIVSYTAKDASQNSGDYSDNVALFNSTIMHSLQIIMPDADYNKMLAGYKESGEKDYYRADVIVDGVRINDVGIRLKGNASLRSALGGGMGGNLGGGNRPNGNMPGNGQQPGANINGGRQQPPAGGPGQKPAAQTTPQPPQIPAQAEGQATPQANNQAPQVPQGSVPGGFGQSAGAETKIPFMIKFNEYVDGQNYQGYREIAVRNYGTSFDAAMLQEPITNDVAQLVGLPATQTAYAGFKINGPAEKLYVISEIVNKEYLEKYFDHPNGLLYKAEIGSNLSYRGEDPDLYTQSFSQETHSKTVDMAPLITFTRFLSQSDDATFESDLPKYLDVDAFATYLAVNDLLVNTDSMIGMDNNYYLYYDESANRFTLLMWDANESMGKLGGSATYSVSLTNTHNKSAGGGMNQPGNNNGDGGPGGGGHNTLLTRFMANKTFKALYEKKLQLVYQKAFASGAMTQSIEQYSELIHSVNDKRELVNIDAYDQAVKKTLNFISQRTAYLETTGMFEQHTQGTSYELNP
jgi:spore coat protein CotH